jgi:diacylglycerol kinase family enzyme
MSRERVRSAFYSCTFIINPTRFPEYAKILKRILKRAEVPKIIESESKEHFIESVREFCHSPYRYLLVWGGDGTAHDAITTLVEESAAHPQLRKTKSVGFLRGGSGNGIQDSYEVPMRIRKQVEVYAEAMQNHYTIDVDLLETTSGEKRSYCQLVGFGFDAEVLEHRARKVYRRGIRRGQIRRGMFTYFTSVLSIWLNRYDAIQREQKTLDLYEGKYSFKGTRVNAEFPFDYLRRRSTAVEIEIGSRPYYGKFFKICPDVVCNDGFLDVYLFNLESRLSIVPNAVWLWMGRHDRINKKLARGNKAIIERYEVKRVTISADKEFRYHVDGEVRTSEAGEQGGHEVSIRVLPAEISFLVPPAFYRKFHPVELM